MIKTYYLKLINLVIFHSYRLRLSRYLCWLKKNQLFPWWLANSYIPQKPTRKKKRKNTLVLCVNLAIVWRPKSACFYVISIRLYSISFPIILRSYPISRWFSKALLDYHRLYPLMPVISTDLSHLQKPQHQWIGAEPEMRAIETDHGNDPRVLRYNSKSNSNP